MRWLGISQMEIRMHGDEVMCPSEARLPAHVRVLKRQRCEGKTPELHLREQVSPCQRG